MALVPARTSFIECATKHTLAPPNESDESKRLKQLIVLLFTPIGASAQYYSSDDDWREFHHMALMNAQNKHSFSLQGIVLALFELFENFNSRLIKSVQAREYIARGLARNAFSTTVPRSTPVWMHGFLQALLLDKIVWACRPRPSGADLRPHQQPFFKKPCSLPDKAKKVFDLYTNWDVTVSTFVHNWDLNEETSRVNTDGEGRESEQTADVMSSLYHGYSEIATNMHIAKVEQTLCIAALGLMGLMLVSLITLVFIIQTL